MELVHELDLYEMGLNVCKPPYKLQQRAQQKLK